MKKEKRKSVVEMCGYLCWEVNVVGVGWEEVRPAGNAAAGSCRGWWAGLRSSHQVSSLPSRNRLQNYNPAPDVTYLIVTKYKLKRLFFYKLPIISETK